MKAVYYEEFGAAEALKVGELTAPKPKTGQVLVRVAAAGVNPIDRRLRSGELQGYFQREWPIIPGWDFSGRIEQLGAEVENWQIGDDVFGLAFDWFLHNGTYAEYVCVDDNAIATKPAKLTFDAAASIPLVSLTAWQALQEYANLRAGQTVLIQAGAGGVGSVAIPMAKHLGAKVYTTARSANHDYVRSLGADVAIDYSRSSYVDIIQQHEPAGLDMVLESLQTDEAIVKAVELVKNGGTVVYLNNEPPELAGIFERNIKTELLHLRTDGAMLADLVKLFLDGTVPIPKMQVLPLEKAAEAHRQSEQWHTVGKVVLHIQDL